MCKIAVDSFINGLKSIAEEKPFFIVGHDGSDGGCDEIGFIRGGLLRGGAIKIKHMKEINQFARMTAVDIRNIGDFVHKGSVLLKTRAMNDSISPLPSQYNYGGSSFNGDVTNYADVAVVINEMPLEIMSMTLNGVAVNSNIQKWDYVCELPYVKYEWSKDIVNSSIIRSENGAIVKLFASTSFSSNVLCTIPDGTKIIVNKADSPWSNVSFDGKVGYVLSKFIVQVEEQSTVEVEKADREELEKAYMILGKILGYIK